MTPALLHTRLATVPRRPAPCPPVLLTLTGGPSPGPGSLGGGVLGPHTGPLSRLQVYGRGRAERRRRRGLPCGQKGSGQVMAGRIRPRVHLKRRFWVKSNTIKSAKNYRPYLCKRKLAKQIQRRRYSWKCTIFIHVFLDDDHHNSSVLEHLGKPILTQNTHPADHLPPVLTPVGPR